MQPLSFRPNYQRRPQIQLNNSPPKHELTIAALPILQTQETPPKRTALDYEKMLTGRILSVEKNKFVLKNLMSLIKNPKIEEELVPLNAQHWTTWFQETAKLKLHFITYEEKLDLSGIYYSFLDNMEKLNVTSFQYASLINSISHLKRSVPPPQVLIDRLANKSIEILADLTEKEITILLKGGKFLFSNEQKNVLFESVIKAFPLNRYQKAHFHVKASLIEAFTSLKVYLSHPQIWKNYLGCATKACLNESDLNLKDILSLVKTLGVESHHNVHEIKAIELLLLKRPMNDEDLIKVVAAFSNANYIPYNFKPKIITLLNSRETQPWNKIILFDVLGRLGYTEILPQLKTFVDKEVIKLDSKKSCAVWQTIYAEDLIKLISSIASLYEPSDKLPPHMKEIIQRILHRFDNFTPETKSACYEACVAIGFGLEIGKVYTPEKATQEPISKLQTRMTHEIKTWLISNSLKFQMFEEFDIKGRNVDLLFKRQNKSPVVCEIDSLHYHFCCNDPNRNLGGNRIRNKFLTQSGYQVFSFVANNDPTSTQEQLNALLKLLKGV